MKNSSLSVLIPAAGRGKRLGILTRNKNKSLLMIDGKELILHSICNFRLFGIRNVIVVLGYKKNQVAKTVGNLAKLCYNPFYQKSGILDSVWRAKTQLIGRPFIFTTSDHYFHPSVLENLLNTPGKLSIVIQKKENYQDEDLKVQIENNQITKFGKKMSNTEATGEFAGMAFFDAEASTCFFKEIETFFKNGKSSYYVMDVIYSISQKCGISVNFSFCDEYSRIEIDSVRDLVQGRKLKSIEKHNPLQDLGC